MEVYCKGTLGRNKTPRARSSASSSQRELDPRPSACGRIHLLVSSWEGANVLP